MAGRLDDSDRSLRKSLELSPQRITAHFMLALNELTRGRLDEALAETRLEPAPYVRLTGLAVVHHARGEHEESGAALQELVTTWGRTSAFQVAGVHARREEIDRAFHWLEIAWAQRDPGLIFVRPEPIFRPLHSDARWRPFLEKMGLLWEPS
jgi:hypothetical protein